MLHILIQILFESIQSFLKVWHWIFLGFLAAGVIREFVSEKRLKKMIGGQGLQNLLKASIWGVVADVLPHSTLPLAISIFNLGASRASVLVFMVSTPWMCIIESLILVSFTGIKTFLLIMLMSMVISVSGGLVIEYLEKKGLIESEEQKSSSKLNSDISFERYTQRKAFRERILSALQYSYDFFKIVAKWLAIGFLGGGIVQVLIPREIISHMLGYSFYSIPLAFGLATILEVSLEASIPIICSLYSLGASLGVLFTMLMAGIVTDITEIGTIWAVMGKRTAIASTLTFSFLTLILGYLINIAITIL